MTSAIEPAKAGRAPDRIWTIPNALSALRLLGVPIFLWLVLVPQADLLAFALLIAAGVSDWLDGAIARATGQLVAWAQFWIHWRIGSTSQPRLLG